MKKFSALILALAMIFAALCLFSCGEEKEAPADTTYADMVFDKSGKNTPATDNQKHEYTVTPGVADYDSDGNLILKSTDNRYVYLKENGYIIFSFSSTTGNCFQVLDVRTFADEEKAAEFLSENVVEMMNSGYYANVNQSGKHVVFTVTIGHPTYSKYLKEGGRDGVTADFPEELKQ